MTQPSHLSRGFPSSQSSTTQPWTIGQWATLACLWEVSAPKVGNVHRGADFANLSLYDFLVSAVAIGPAMQAAAERGVGATVLAAIRATSQVARSNTNLGTVLLLAPLAKSVALGNPRETISQVLRSLTPDDASSAYEAIRLANPGGMGRVEQHDVADSPPADLLVAMQAAAERDLVARQYVTNFADVFATVVPWLSEALQEKLPLHQAIVHVQLRMMSAYPDSLIGRKCGPRVAQESADRAAGVLSYGTPEDDAYQAGLSDFDFWLRSDGHRRNPGTTADMMAAGLFVALCEGIIQVENLS